MIASAASIVNLIVCGGEAERDRESRSGFGNRRLHDLVARRRSKPNLGGGPAFSVGSRACRVDYASDVTAETKVGPGRWLEVRTGRPSPAG